MKLQRGLSLIELLVALAIGAVLVFGATQVYVNSRKTYDTNETVARVQETARFAMSVLEPDIRLANFWGMVKGASAITGQALENAAAATVASGTGANVCGNNLAVDLNTPVKGFDNRYWFTEASAPTTACDQLATTLPSGSSDPVLTADTLIIRRAAATPSTPANNVIQLCTNRQNGFLFSDGGTGACVAAKCGVTALCAATDAAPQDRTAAVYNLVAHAYYVDKNSDGRAGVPSLRRKRLVGNSFVDEEVISGVEDMQVQFGIETGINDPVTNPVTGDADQYVNPEDVDLAPNSLMFCNCQVVSVRLWLMVRGDTAEIGFTDDRIYTYGSRINTGTPTGDLDAVGAVTRAFQPSLIADASATGPRHVRRLLVSRTIQLRNAWGT